MAYQVLVTARSFGKVDGAHQDYLAQHGCETHLRAQANPMTAAELRQIIAGYDGVILGLDICDASVIEAADRLKVISRYGAGVDAVDLEAAARRGIAVTNTPGANRIAVAELTIGMIFALARNLPQAANAARRNQWLRTPGWELAGKTLGLIGLGAIGREVAARATALGMRVLAYDPYTGDDEPGVERVDLPTLLRDSHVVSLHCAATPETENLINAERIAAMRDGAYLINTARGSLVDESALYQALTSGKLAGAALDVFRDDPPTDHPLLQLDNCIGTPHLGATTVESAQRMALMAAQNLVAVLRGEPCDFIVNSQAFNRYRSHA